MKASETAPTLIYLYGPPASGKLTIAEKLSVITNYQLFHNHQTVNAIRSIFEYGTQSYIEVLHRLRLDVFATATRAGISLIFTNNSAWGGSDSRSRFAFFANEVARVVGSEGGRTVFVHVTAPREVLEDRVSGESRRVHDKLLDVGRLRELLDELDDSPLHANDLTIDSAAILPDQAARLIASIAFGDNSEQITL